MNNTITSGYWSYDEYVLPAFFASGSSEMQCVLFWGMFYQCLELLIIRGGHFFFHLYCFHFTEVIFTTKNKKNIKCFCYTAVLQYLSSKCALTHFIIWRQWTFCCLLVNTLENIYLFMKHCRRSTPSDQKLIVSPETHCEVWTPVAVTLIEW